MSDLDGSCSGGNAAVDGNVMRVVSRVTGDGGEISSLVTKARFTEAAQLLLDRARPGDFNQAMMELGATVCIPRAPRCGECPVSRFCDARATGRESQLPVKLKKNASRDVPLNLALLRNASGLFLIQRAADERRLAGFWELPQKNLLPRWRGRPAAQFTHQIVNDRFRISVFEGPMPKALPPGKWFAPHELDAIPLTTVTRKALTLSGTGLKSHVEARSTTSITKMEE
ncbi:MAG TPA: hypothetical protein VFT60_02980 [Bryobacteraceae bacterium]|nr:hypothetical protein [Bryobacteraceae bacterium]